MSHPGWSIRPDEVVAELAAGTSGRVRVVRAPGLLGVRPLIVARDVAPAAQHDEAVGERILLAHDITHPGWTRVLGALHVGDDVCLATELVAGCALDHLARGALTVETVEHVVAKAAAVLESLHRGRDALGRPRRLVHGSVTPDKLMISFGGDVKLLDFGITGSSARAQLPAAEWPAWLPWVPPELLDGAAPTPATDLYMLGATMYLLLTGQPPYAKDAHFESLAWQTLPRPSRLRPEVRPSLDDLVMSTLDPDPSMRPMSARQLQDVLDAKPARIALSAVVKDAAPDRLRLLEDLTHSRAMQAPLIEASPIGPNDNPVGQLITLPVRPVSAEPKSEDIDSVDILRRSVHDIFNEPPKLAPRALPASIDLDPSRSLDLEPLVRPSPSAAVPPSAASWRRPAGVLMLLCAALMLTLISGLDSQTSLLDVHVRPADATVSILERPGFGAKASLPPGRYRVRASKAGHEPVEMAIQLEPGEHRLLMLDLAPGVQGPPRP